MTPEEQAEMDQLRVQNANMKQWALAANKFAWAHERSCPRHDADEPCNCGLDTFLARPRIAVEDAKREIQREQMERDAEIVQIQIAAARSIHVCTGCAELARNRIRGEFDSVPPSEQD